MGRTGEMSVVLDRADASPARVESAPAGAGVDVLVHRAHDAIDSLAPEWSALAGQTADPNPFAEHWFAAIALRTLGADRDIRLLEARRGGRLIGIMLVSIERGYAHLPVRYVQNWYHDHIFLGDPLVAAGEEQAFWPAILATLNEADWAPGFLHLRGLVEGGAVQRALFGDLVHRRLRAFLHSDLDPAAYYARAVRQKKRKEIRRLRNRLEEIGPVQARELADEVQLSAWCDAYLALEKAGWKGREGSGLACRPETESFFREALAAAWSAGRLQFLRLDVGGRPIAMLVNLLTPPGGYSFKTVFDEDFARFSPGVLIQIENLEYPRARGHRLDGQLRGRRSSDDRRPVDRAPLHRPDDGTAERRAPLVPVQAMPRARKGFSRPGQVAWSYRARALAGRAARGRSPPKMLSEYQSGASAPSVISRAIR